jgi:uncharacterized protein YdhG (YjbR/CyaY superfamily)
MKTPMKNFKNIDEYIKSFPKEVQKDLILLRATIKKLVPKGEDAIRYGMPTIRLNDKNFLHFAAYEKHIGFYPTPGPIEFFKKELAKYKTSKGAIQFPLGVHLPVSLITKIIKYRNKEAGTVKK